MCIVAICVLLKFSSYLITIRTAVALHPWSNFTIVIIVIPCHDEDNLVSFLVTNVMHRIPPHDEC